MRSGDTYPKIAESPMFRMFRAFISRNSAKVFFFLIFCFIFNKTKSLLVNVMKRFLVFSGKIQCELEKFFEISPLPLRGSNPRYPRDQKNRQAIWAGMPGQ